MMSAKLKIMYQQARTLHLSQCPLYSHLVKIKLLPICDMVLQSSVPGMGMASPTAEKPKDVSTNKGIMYMVRSQI